MSDLHFSLLSTAIMQSPEDEINRSRNLAGEDVSFGFYRVEDPAQQLEQSIVVPVLVRQSGDATMKS